MLGERGLWYKLNFFEPSTRIPMIVHAPGRVDAGVVQTATSLLDIAPTLLDVAGIKQPDSFCGDSLISLASGFDPQRTVLGEYLGEGAIAPIFMIRRGSQKYVWSAPDPPLLYDLAADPHELDNIAVTHPDGADFEAEIHATWNVAEIDNEVRASQQARACVDRALRQGRYTAWDFQPTTDATNQYMRNHLDLNSVESSRRA
jgi:choline-sulfatase